MAKNTQQREAKIQRERLRGYKARVALNEEVTARRRRDNGIWAGIGLTAVGVAIAVQVLVVNNMDAVAAPTPSSSAPAEAAEQGSLPPSTLAEGRTWTGDLQLNDVNLAVELDGAAAPQAVSSTIHLINTGFYQGLSCHRLTTAESMKVLQCGDNQQGGPGYNFGPIENAPADNFYPQGTIAMARVGNDAASMNSQFFIVYGDSTIGADSAGGYSVIGTVTDGLDELIAQVTNQGTENGQTDGAPKVPVTINSFDVK